MTRSPVHAPHAPALRIQVPWRRVGLSVLLVALLGASLVVLLPQLAGADQAWQRLQRGSGAWLAAAVGAELLSFGGYVAVFRAVLGGGRVGWSASLLITMAGVAATRLLAAGGAGGIALTGWALRREGRGPRETVVGITSFLVVLYAVYMAALIVGGAALLTGVVPGPRAPALSGAALVIGTSVALLALVGTAVPAHPRTRLVRDLGRSAAGRALRRFGNVAGGVPDGIRRAARLVASRDPLLLGAVAWWAFDIAALAACLSAFGSAPAITPLVVAYFMGMLGNLLPLPGGIGGVDGGMIGALLAFGVDPATGVLGVLSYRVFALWIPSALGVPAYVALLRRGRRLSDEDGRSRER